MKKWLKRLFVVIAVVTLPIVALGLHTWFGKPLKISWFYERVFAEYAVNDPEMLTQLGILRPLGLRFYEDKLTDSSPAREDQMAAKLKRDLATLEQYKRDDLTEEGKLSYDVLHYFLSMQVKGDAYRFHNYPVNQLFGVQNGYPRFMVESHPVEDLTGARSYVKRLELVSEKFAGVLAGLKQRTEKGIVPPRFVLEKVILEMQQFIAPTPDQNVLYLEFEKKLAKLALPPEQRDELLVSAKAAIGNQVYTAYRGLIDYYQVLLPTMANNNGVWSLPNGDAYYDYEVQANTTTSMGADEIHALGLSEVARIETEMDQILRQAGYVDGDLSARIEQLSRSPEQLYSNDDAGREQILRDYQSIIDEISKGLDPYFDLRPKAGIEVKRVPAFAEKTAPGAYYNGPAMDGSRPGVFYANLRDTAETPRFGMRTLAYHEGVPGHHFQIAIMQELKGVPTFRRLLPFTAYNEGWALYTEQLAWEIGFQKNPLDNLGRLQAEMFRAVRLVVDTGLHRKRWTREQAIDYMRAKTGMAEGEVTSEIERYLVNPGQALAYKVGMLKILALREKAKAELGERFDIRAFHNEVLSHGALPLAILEQVIDRYIDRVKTG